MVTDFQKQKLTKLFELYDWDGSGALDMKDFAIAIKNLRRVAGLEEDSETVKALVAGFSANWEELRGEADADGDGRVTLGEWMAHNERQLEKEGGYDFIAGGIADMVFSLFDKNGDDRFSLSEYEDLCWAYRLRGFSEAENFKVLSGGAESMTREAFLQRVKEFYQADPEAPGNNLFGPL